MRADQEGQYLMVKSSFMGLFLDPSLEEALLHYDYERDKQDGYPEAHLQVVATSESWEELARRAGHEARPLERLHLPVGGRRYRPTLEELIDFLITEDLADGHPGWTDHVERGKTDFYQKQLRAAIRRDPATALDILRQEGHLPPTEPTASGQPV
jgi:hypothetical protein